MRWPQVTPPEITPPTSKGTTASSNRASSQRSGRPKVKSPLPQRMRLGNGSAATMAGHAAAMRSTDLAPPVRLRTAMYSPLSVVRVKMSAMSTPWVRAKPSAALVGLPSAS